MFFELCLCLCNEKHFNRQLNKLDNKKRQEQHIRKQVRKDQESRDCKEIGDFIAASKPEKNNESRDEGQPPRAYQERERFVGELQTLPLFDVPKVFGTPYPCEIVIRVVLARLQHVNERVHVARMVAGQIIFHHINSRINAATSCGFS